MDPFAEEKVLASVLKESDLMECSPLAGQTDGKSDSEAEHQEQPTV